MEEGTVQLAVAEKKPVELNPELVRHYAEKLGLSEWHISLSTEVAKDCAAETDINEQARHATIHPGDGWADHEEHETIVHELIHLVLADLAWGLDSVVMQHLPKGKRDVAEGFIDQEIETICERLSRALVGSWK
jgi:hypothetical protein